jgi:hypothetical protein
MTPADDSTGFAQAAFAIASGPRKTMAAVRTLFTTEHAYDAGLAGFYGPTDPGVDGGFSVTFDGRDSIPSVVLNGSDGEITVSGADAILQLAQALVEAATLANRMAVQS